MAGYYAYYHEGLYLRLGESGEVTSFMSTDADTIYMTRDGERAPFEIRGVNLGVGIPGEWATDYAVDEETYLRWFRSIQELGANTIRVYITLHDDFYNAFYTYNTQREAEGLEPLWLLHGVWVNDYIQFSHRDAYDEDFLGAFLEDCRSLVDVLHGERDLSLGRGTGSGSYRKDVSPWGDRVHSGSGMGGCDRSLYQRKIRGGSGVHQLYRDVSDDDSGRHRL